MALSLLDRPAVADAAGAQDIRDAVAALKAAQLALSDEIRSYPTPISGCDAQFNGLLAERRRVARALAALGEPVHIPTPRAP